jgi:polysaccharide export outer membrane protein
MRKLDLLGCLPLVFVTAVAAQQPVTSLAPPPGEVVQRTYKLGVGDQITIKAPSAEEISDKPFRVDSEGFLSIPMIGKIPAQGLTAEELEANLNLRLAEFLKAPQVSVTVLQSRPEPVFLVGAFKNPGIFSAAGGRTLIELLTAAGGLLPNASRRIRIVRKKEMGLIPLPGARVNIKDQSSTAEVTLSSLQGSIGPTENIVLMPFDVVSADRADPIYVDGEVARPGIIELGERESESLIQVVTQSGGLGKEASSNVRILRPAGDSLQRTQTIIDFKKVLTGQVKDVPIYPNDIVFVPRANGRVALTRATTIALALGVTLIAGLVVAGH